MHVTGSWADQDHIVDGMEDNWRVKLDAELIVFLLEQNCQISVYSEEDLAGALFNQRSDVSPVQDCIAYLLAEQRCEVAAKDLSIRLKA